MAVADWVRFLAACFLSKHSLMLSHLLFYHPTIATAAFGALIAFLESWFCKSQFLENWSRGKKEKEEYMWVVAEMIPWHSLRLIIICMRQEEFVVAVFCLSCPKLPGKKVCDSRASFKSKQKLLERLKYHYFYFKTLWWQSFYVFYLLCANSSSTI